MPFLKRRQLIVDSKVQGAILFRTVAYWAFCLAMVFVVLLWWEILTGPRRSFFEYMTYVWHEFDRVFIAGLIVIPFVAIDCLRMTNRLAGPVFRLRLAMRELALGKTDEPLRFREGDFWQQCAADFNALRDRVRCDSREDNASKAEEVESPA